MLNGPVGLQMRSLRDSAQGLPALASAMGFRDVEGADSGSTPSQSWAALDKAGLRCQSAHMGFERLRRCAGGLPSEGPRGDCSLPLIRTTRIHVTLLKSAEAFNRFASAEGAGLRSPITATYEMPSPEGTR